ncbi:MAG: hypothetical protein LC731_07075, partial [Acidobacteria bacterium]|nr:hypothetical protein [Acidobacteriota bacterium]
MKDNETRRHEMFLRVREHGTSRAAQFPAGTFASELFTNLKQTITELEESAREQSEGRRTAQESSTSKSVARDELLRDLEAISRTARTLALNTPGLEDKFRAPRNLKDQETL